jgi:hypothetical protein
MTQVWDNKASLLLLLLYFTLNATPGWLFYAHKNDIWRVIRKSLLAVSPHMHKRPLGGAHDREMYVKALTIEQTDMTGSALLLVRSTADSDSGCGGRRGRGAWVPVKCVTLHASGL